MAYELVSVLMPVYKTPELFLRESIDSVLGQTHKNLELVIVEDPSDSPNRELIASYADPRIRYHLNSARTSLLAQRNKTVELATGDFLAMLDSDDTAEPDRLAVQLQFLRDNPSIDVVGSNISIVDERSRIVGHRAYPSENADIIATMAIYNAVANPTVMLRRSVFEACGNYQFNSYQGIGEDYEFWSRCAQAGIKFGNIPRNLVRYRVHAGATKAEKLRQHLDATIAIKKQYWLSSMGTKALTRYYLEHLIRHLPGTLVTGMFKAIYFSKATGSGTQG